MALGATAAIDQEIISLSGIKHPSALLIPTATSDDPQYFKDFQKIYGNRYGCKTDVLELIKTLPSKKIIKQKINDADIIYVGGGNTLMMMRKWRFLGVDKMIVNAWKEGKVMAGLSAGAICWFNYGHSDSMAYYQPEKWDWIKVKCLGILPFTACPHVLAEGRLKHFKNMIQKTGRMGIALDDCAAIEVIENEYHILTSKPNAKAFKVFKKGKELITENFLIDGKFRSLKELSTTN